MGAQEVTGFCMLMGLDTALGFTELGMHMELVLVLHLTRDLGVSLCGTRMCEPQGIQIIGLDGKLEQLTSTIGVCFEADVSETVKGREEMVDGLTIGRDRGLDAELTTIQAAADTN